jgi:hypothetical protein
MTKSEQAVRTMIKRIRDDARVAYLIGPFSQAYDELTDAYAETIGKDPDEFRKEFEAILKFQKVPALGEEPQS